MAWKRIAKPGFRLTIALLPVVALLWLALSRWSGVPARLLPGRGSPAPATQMTAQSKELSQLLMNVPPLPAFTLPKPPPGYRWERPPRAGLVDLYRAVTGTWTPDTRPNLHGCIAYLRSPEVTGFLDSLSDMEIDVRRIPIGHHPQIKQVCRMLVVRARMRHEQGEIDGAIDDLLTALRLAAACRSGDMSLYLTGYAHYRLACFEFGRMSHDCALTKQQAMRFMKTAASIAPPFDEMWGYVVQAEKALHLQTLDESYSLEPDGNGWLVLSHYNSLIFDHINKGDRTGLWNAFSILYNDRKTVESKIQRYLDTLKYAGTLPYRQAQNILQEMADAPPFNHLDGPIWASTNSRHGPRQLRWLALQELWTRFVPVNAALSRFKADNEEYPDSLEQLLGQYLGSIPVDPLSGMPLKYRAISDNSDYLLYSIGANMKDEGGAQQARKGPDDINDGHIRHDAYGRANKLIKK